MGVGKTSIGKRLAKALGIPFRDSDHVLTAANDASISQLFDSRGEAGFRILEAEALRSMAEKDSVISTGGGTPCFHNNMEYMLANGLVIWFKVRPEIIASRLKMAKNSRPLIAHYNDDEILDFVKAKLADREPFYRKANIQFDATNFSSQRLTELVEAIATYSK